MATLLFFHIIMVGHFRHRMIFFKKPLTKKPLMVYNDKKQPMPALFFRRHFYLLLMKRSTSHGKRQANPRNFRLPRV